ncbi:MAG: hypothetical protein ABEH81_09315 [Halopenitus sp.]
MHRRSVLALLGSTLSAGCAGFGANSSSTDSPAGTPPTDTPTGTEPPSDDGTGLQPEQRWSLVDFETLSRTVSVTPTTRTTDDGGSVAVVFERTATADGPARLRGTLTNESPYANTFELRRVPLFDTVPAAWPGDRPHDESYTYRDELLLAPTENHAIAETVPDWSQAPDGRWRLAGEADGPWLPETHRLGAGESVTFEYALLGRREGSGFPTARYHFRGDGGVDTGVVLAVWETGNPGPTTSSAFEGTVVPPLPGTKEMAWYHDADATTTAYLEPAAQRLELPASVEFTLRNHGRAELSGNPYFWKLWKHVDGQWFHVAPWGWPVPLTWVPPGDTESWTLAAFGGKAVECDEARSVGHLGGGRYAFQIGIGRDKRTHAALLDVEAPPASVEPTEGLTVERDGGVVTVDWPHREDEVPQATLTLTRAAGVDPDTRLITEQVMQNRNVALRNTLAFWGEETERVELVTDRNTVSRGARTGGYEDGTFQFRYEGTAFEAAADFESS